MLSKKGGVYRVAIGREQVDASIRGRLKLGPRKVLVGDAVVTLHHQDGSITIEQVQQRVSLLRRRAPGKKRGVRPVAANLDQVIVVGAARDPSWDHKLMDRFVVVAEANDLSTTIVVNKVDLVDDASPCVAPYRDVGYQTVETSVPGNIGIDDLASCLHGKVSLFAGPTGVGKSSLLNAVQPGLHLRTAEVSGKPRTGRHTTVAAEMHALNAGGYVVDTPGLRDVGLWGVDAPEVAKAFPELGWFVGRCRFDDCRHLSEPGCAVAQAATAGEVYATRLASYRSLLQEALDAARPWERGGSR